MFLKSDVGLKGVSRGGVGVPCSVVGRTRVGDGRVGPGRMGGAGGS